MKERSSIMEKITFFLQTLLWPLFRLSLHWFGSIRITGKENVKGYKSGAIFAVNHRSQLDPFLIPATLNPFSSLMPMHYVSRKRDFYDVRGITRYAYGGFVFKIFGAYPAIPKIKDYEKMLPHHIELLLRGQSVCIFPEGKLNSSGILGQGKLGAAYLLWRTGRPIIPTAIYGHEGMGPIEFFARRHKIVVSYGPPITRDELFGVNAKQQPIHEKLIAATEIIMARIRELLPTSNSRD